MKNRNTKNEEWKEKIYEMRKEQMFWELRESFEEQLADEDIPWPHSEVQEWFTEHCLDKYKIEFGENMLPVL